MLRKPHALFSLIATLLLLGIRAISGAISLVDTIELLPGPDAYFPDQLAVNHATHKVYVQGAAASGAQDLAVKVLDSTTGALVGNIDLGRVVNGDVITRFEPRGIAADESTNANGNRVYVIGASGNSFYIRTFQNDAVVAGADVALAGNPDPYVGFSPITVNSNTHKVYFVTDFGQVTVVDGPSHSKLTTFDSGTGFGPHLWVTNPDANKIFLFGRSGAVVIDGASDIATPMTVPPQFSATAGVYNPGTGRVYVFGADNNGVSGIYSFNSNGASAGSVATPISLAGRAMTVDPATNTLYLGAPLVGTEPGGIYAYSAVDLSAKGSFNQGAAWLAFDSGRIFLLHYDFNETFAETRNRVGILNVSDGSLSTTTVAYKPHQAAVNAQTNRVYVIDEANADLVVINGADHSIIARVPVNPVNSGSYYAKQMGLRPVGVSEALNRIYLPRAVQISDDGTKTVFLDVIDGSNHQLIASIPLVTGFVSPSNFLAVDDNRHRVYLTGVDDSNNPVLRVINADTNLVTTSFPTFNSVLGLAVNPVTGKIYVSGRPSGGQVQIFDGTTFASLGVVNAGAVPGPMAVNTTTNKIYVANLGAGSVDNSVTVINGATDATETTFSNTNANNGDAVSDVAVDPVANKIYVADNSNGFDATGRITIFNGANNSFQQQIEVGRYPNGLAFNTTSKELIVPNNEDGNLSVIGTGLLAGPPPPAHGGLSETFFRVNGSKTPGGNVADTVLHFAAQQSGTPNGLKVQVQFNTVADNNRNDWVDLNNGTEGYMTIDKNTEQFVLSSTNYPLASGIYFRALSTAPGYPNSASNIVGPFDLTPGKNHLGTTTLLLAANGGGQPMYYRAVASTDQAGITFYIQATTSPDDESSWAGLNDGRSGQMFSFPDVKKAYLDSDKYPTGNPVYFRALAKAVGFVDSYSNIVGIANVVNGTPPEVSVFPTTFDQLQPGSGSGTTPDDPLILQLGSMKFSVVASSAENNAFTKLALYFDGSVIDERDAGATNMNTDYITNVPGDHILKALAIDKRGVVGYANSTYLRLLPAGAKVYKSVGWGNWNDASIWQDTNGNSGVPGPADFAVISGGAVTVTTPTTVLAIAVNGVNNATVLASNGGGLTVNGMCTVHNGMLKDIDLLIGASATMQLTGDQDTPISGTVTNRGTIRLTGNGGIVPVSRSAALRANSGLGQTNGIVEGIGAFFSNLGDFIFNHPKTPAPKPGSSPAPAKSPVVAAASLENKGRLVSEKGASIISVNSGGLVGNSGGTLIGNDGASLITNDGGSVISNDSASIVAQGGGNVVIQPNAGNAKNVVRVLSASGGSIQNSGQIDLSGLVLYSSVTLDGGLLTGSGAIFGDVTNNSGFVSPGNSAGQITVLGNFTQGMQGTLLVDDGGPGDSDLLQVSGNVTLGGQLKVRLIDNSQPGTDDTFSPLGYSSATGSFNTRSANTQASANANGLLVSVDAAKPSPVLGQPTNISTRAQVLSGDQVMIGGFIVTGTAPKTVVLRAIAPTLAQYGLTGLLPDPVLTLVDNQGKVIKSNNNWKIDDATGQSQEASVPINLRPPNALESAIVATLQPNQNYTVIVTGNGGTGVALVEAYDNDPSDTSRFTNISTRGVVGTGGNVMIGGFIVATTGPGKVVVRGIGPSLTQYGVSGALQDPLLQLYDANGNLLMTNDNWNGDQGAELQSLNKAPSDPHESAIVGTLMPGSYTAILSGKGASTGVGLVEVYDVQ